VRISCGDETGLGEKSPVPHEKVIAGTLPPTAGELLLGVSPSSLRKVSQDAKRVSGTRLDPQEMTMLRTQNLEIASNIFIGATRWRNEPDRTTDRAAVASRNLSHGDGS